MLGSEFNTIEPLPTSLTFLEFETWKAKLKSHLESFQDFYLFLPGGIYSTWKSLSDSKNGMRIVSINSKDPESPQLTSVGLVSKRNSQLNSLLYEIGKQIDRSEYHAIYNFSTSFNLVMDFLLEFRNAQCRPKNILQLRHMVYKENQDLDQFYNSFRSMIFSNLRRKGDRISFQGGAELTCDETISPTFEEIIVMWCLERIDPRLPDLVHKAFGLQLMNGRGLKDLQEEIFDIIPALLEESSHMSGPVIKLECKVDNFEDVDEEFHDAGMTADGIEIYVKDESTAVKREVPKPIEKLQSKTVKTDSMLKSIPPLTRGVCSLCGTTLRKKNLKNHLFNKHKLETWDQNVFMLASNTEENGQPVNGVSVPNCTDTISSSKIEHVKDKNVDPAEENCDDPEAVDQDDNSLNQENAKEVGEFAAKSKTADFPSILKGICILCGKKLRRKNFKTHLVRFHEKEKFSWSIKGMDDDDLFLELPKDQDCASTEKFNQVKVPRNGKLQGRTAAFQRLDCPLCEKTMRWKNMKIHFRKVHAMTDLEINKKLSDLRVRYPSTENQDTSFFQLCVNEHYDSSGTVPLAENVKDNMCCFMCQTTIQCSSEKEHLTIVHQIETSIADSLMKEVINCPLCDVNLERKDVKAHVEEELEKICIEEVSNDEKVKCFLCDICLSRNELRAHTISHHGWNPSIPEVSGKDDDASNQDSPGDSNGKGDNLSRCPICDAECGADHMVSHLMAAHRVVRWVARQLSCPRPKCPVCQATLPAADSLKKHMQDEIDTKFGDTPQFSNLHCSLCGRTSKMISMKHHLIRVHQWYPNSNEKLTTRLSMARTFAEDEEALPYLDSSLPVECPECDATTTLAGLRQHMKKVHNNKSRQDGDGDISPPPPAVFMCEMCGTSFDTAAKLRNHKLRHPEFRDEFLCPICGKVTTSMQSLSIHMNRHNQKHHCPRCTKNCKSDEGVQEHLAKKRCGRTIKRIRDKNLFCATCKRHFIDVDQMEHHKCAHLKCDMCGTEFVRLRNLKVHKRIHDGETIFPCEMCESLFVTRKKYQEHKRTIHDPNHRVYKFKCDMCDATFMSRSAANHHLHRVHVTERKYGCNLCTKKFKSYEHLKIHLDFTHKQGKLQFSCEGCDKKFRGIGELKYHCEMSGCGTSRKEDLAVTATTTTTTVVTTTTTEVMEIDENVENIIFEFKS